MDRVYIKDLEVWGIVGIDAEELTTEQKIVVNAVMYLDTSRAAASDDIQDTIDYRAVAERIISHVEAAKPKLIERLGDEIAAICLEDPRIERVEVAVEKPDALTQARSVGVTVLRLGGDSSL